MIFVEKSGIMNYNKYSKLYNFQINTSGRKGHKDMAENFTNNKNSLLKQYDDNCRLYQAFVAEIEHQIKSILQTSELKCNNITSRLKTRESITEKIERKQGKYTDISNITDIAGVRIITYYSEDVDKIAEIIENEFDVDHENSIDKRKSLEPDKFGYCSVHYVVKMSAQRLLLREYQNYKDMKCEIQIRSVLQHAWAEIEHDIGYKSEITIPKEMRRSFSRIAGLLEIADKEFDSIRQALKEYENNVHAQIDDDNFSDSELDAVILDTLINNNQKIQTLSDHISNLFKQPLQETANHFEYESTIKQLNYLGIKTVKEINDAITLHLNSAMNIASKIIDHSDENDFDDTVPKTIAFFYLSYAILIYNHNNEQDIINYLINNNIGLPKERQKIAQELMSCKQLIPC